MPRLPRLHVPDGFYLHQIEQLGPKEKRRVLQSLDTVIEREKLRRRIAA